MSANNQTLLAKSGVAVQTAAIHAWLSSNTDDMGWTFVDDPQSVVNPNLVYTSSILDALAGHRLPEGYRREVRACIDPESGEESYLFYAPEPDSPPPCSMREFDLSILTASSKNECDTAVLDIVKQMLLLDLGPESR